MSLSYAQVIVANTVFNISFLFWLYLRLIFERLTDILAFISGALTDCIYVNASGKDQIPCGSVITPCSSLSFTINVFYHNETICLIASPIKQIRYTVENTIVIKHSLTVTKFPVYGQNPLITYGISVTSNRKDFYAFGISRYALASYTLTFNIKSVNFYVNILNTFSERLKTIQKIWLLDKNLTFNCGFQFQIVLSVVLVVH